MTRLHGGRPGFDSGQGQEYFFATASRPVQRPTQSPVQWVHKATSPAVKWPGCEADHSPSSSAEVKNEWRYTSTPPYVFMAWCLSTGTASALYFTLQDSASYPVGSGGCFPGSNATLAWSYHSPSSTADVKTAWSYTSIPPTYPHTNSLIYERDFTVVRYRNWISS
jgi:hypothetical protein